MTPQPLNVLSLFSGIGGLELGLERAGMRVVGQVEIDGYCRRVLAKHWPDVPRHDDVRTAADWWLSQERPTVDVICGGFPCQDISSAGRGAGIVAGERSSLWSFMADAVRRVRPRYVLVENVPRVLVRGRDGVIPAELVAADLAACGYDLRWDCIPAAAVGARHRRDRWFGIAYANSDALRAPAAQRDVADAHGGTWPPATRDAECRVGRGEIPIRTPELGRRGSDVAYADGERLEGRRLPAGPRNGTADADGRGQILEWRRPETSSQWTTEPDVGRVVNGAASRLDRATENARLRALGNAVVPQVAEYVGRLIVDHASRRVA